MTKFAVQFSIGMRTQSPANCGAVIVETAKVLFAPADGGQPGIRRRSHRPGIGTAPANGDAVGTDGTSKIFAASNRGVTNLTILCRRISAGHVLSSTVNLPVTPKGAGAFLQVRFSSALIAANTSPSGGDDWPCQSAPQQTGEPSIRRAQVCQLPLLIAEKTSPSGGEDWPSLSLPQHTGEPSSRRAQVCRPPLLIAANAFPSGGED